MGMQGLDKGKKCSIFTSSPSFWNQFWKNLRHLCVPPHLQHHHHLNSHHHHHHRGDEYCHQYPYQQSQRWSSGGCLLRHWKKISEFHCEYLGYHEYRLLRNLSKQIIFL